MPSKRHRSSRVHFVSKSSRDVTQWCNTRGCLRPDGFKSPATDASDGGCPGDANTEHASVFGAQLDGESAANGTGREYAEFVLTPNPESCRCAHRIRQPGSNVQWRRGRPVCDLSCARQAAAIRGKSACGATERMIFLSAPIQMGIRRIMFEPISQMLGRRPSVPIRRACSIFGDSRSDAAGGVGVGAGADLWPTKHRNDGPVRQLKAGESFYESPAALHAV